MKFQKMRENLNFLNTPRKLSITKLNKKAYIRTSYGFKPHWLGEKSPSLSLGTYYNNIMIYNLLTL